MYVQYWLSPGMKSQPSWKDLFEKLQLVKDLCIQRNLQEGYFGLEVEWSIEAVQIQVIWKSEIFSA